MFCHFVWVALLIFKSISLCLFLFFNITHVASAQAIRRLWPIWPTFWSSLKQRGRILMLWWLRPGMFYADEFCMDCVETLMDFCWSSDGFCIGIVEILMDCSWSSDGFCIGIVEILMDFCWSSDGFCIGIVEILMDFCWILHCPVSSWQVEWPNEDLKPLPLSDAAKESMQRRREALMWGSDAGLCCFAGLVKEPWLSLVSEWSSHMVLWCFLLISKCLLLGSGCVVVGLHGVLWVECLWDGFLLTPGSGCSTALCCWASEPANLCTADLSLCTSTFGVLSRSISWISKSC